MAGRSSPKFRELTAQVQFDVTGAQPGQWHMSISEGKYAAEGDLNLLMAL